MLTYMVRYFVYCPIVILTVLLVAFVFRCVSGRRAKALWTAGLVFCCSRYLVGRWFFGNDFYPEWPPALHWFWCWAFAGAFFLAILSGLTWFWRARAKVWLLPVLAWTIAAIGFWNGVKLPEVRELELRYPDLPAELDGYRIAQLSDLHVSAAARRERTQALVDRTNALGADLICLTGDYVDGLPKTRREDIAPLAGLRAKDGVWCVPGNHEYYFDWSAWQAAYRELGLKFLCNACVFPRKSLALGGATDTAAGRPGKNHGELPDVRKTFAAATNGEFRVLLQHQPKWAPENVRKFGVRLQLSGHTHGGIMPVLMPIVRAHNHGFLQGLYELGDGRLYVHAGSGQWAGFQLRYFDPAEIVVITLRK